MTMINPTTTDQKFHQWDRKILPSYRFFNSSTAKSRPAGGSDGHRAPKPLPFYWVWLMLAVVASTTLCPAADFTSQQLYPDLPKGQLIRLSANQQPETWNNSRKQNHSSIITPVPELCSAATTTTETTAAEALIDSQVLSVHSRIGVDSAAPAPSTGSVQPSPIATDFGGDQEASADNTQIQWLTGKDFESKLSDLQSVVWERATLDQIVEESQRTHQLQIWVDRRVDTSQIVNLQLNRKTVGQSLSTLAQRCQAEVVFLPPVVVIVPQNTASKMLALRAELNHQADQLPAALKRKFLQTEAVAWSKIIQPNDLLRQWISPVADSLEQLDSLPHDLWASSDLPPTSLIDRLLLLSFGFDQHFKITYTSRSLSLTLQPILPDQSITCLIADPTWKTKLKASQNQWSSQFADVQLTTRRSQTLLDGPLENVAAVLQTTLQDNDQPEANRDLSRQRFTLNVTQQLAGNVLQTIAQQTELKLDYDDAAKESLLERIDLNANDLTLEELLKEVGARSGTKIEIHKQRIVVRQQ